MRFLKYRSLLFCILATPALILTGIAPALANPSTAGATFIAYQSRDAAVVLVFYGFTGTDPLDHYEITRDPGGVRLFPNSIPISVTSIEDIGQGLAVGGGPYYYTITVVDSVGNTASLDATYKDAGTKADLPSGSINLFFSWNPTFECLSDTGNCLAGKTWDLFWFSQSSFPDPIAPIHAKYFDTARSPITGAALAGALVSVFPAGQSELATLYADRYGMFERPSPITADSHGRFEFYVPNGRYDIVVSSGSETYPLSDVTIADPRYAQTIHAKPDSAAMTLVTRSEASSNPDGNYPLLLTAPGDQGGSNPNPPYYRILANAGENGWALTHNGRWNESAGQWVFDESPSGQNYDASFFRIRNDSFPSLEFGVDQANFLDPSNLFRQPAMETLFHIGPDKVHLKSLIGLVGIEKTAGEAGIVPGNVVVMQTDGTVVRATTLGAFYPFLVTGVDTPDGMSHGSDTVYVSIGGSNTPAFLDGSVSPCVTMRDPLVTSGGQPGYVVAAPGETDVRKIVGYSLKESCSDTLIMAIPR